MTSSLRLDKLLAQIDILNLQDPHTINTEEYGLITKEVLYSKRMQKRLQRFIEDANEHLVIAAYCQHVKRWAIPRSDYPMDKAGYKKWRSDLGLFHANTTADTMRQFAYSEEDIERVKYLLQKKGLKRDADTQTLEDVICLVFLEFYLDDFAKKHDDDKLVDIIKKTWRKMSDDGHSAALSLPLAPHLLALVKKALQG